MFVTSLNETPDQEEDGYQNKEDHENRQRKRSTVQKFVEVLFYDEGDKIDQSSSQIENDKSLQDDQQGDATKQIAIRLQKLDRGRKKSLLVGVIDGLLSRSDHSRQDLSTENTQNQVAVDIGNKEYATGENDRRQERLQDIQREDYRKKNNTADSVKRELEVDQEGPTSVSAKCRQRKIGIVPSAGAVQLGLPNFGFEDESSEEIQKQEFNSDTSGHRSQKRSVTFSSSELPVQPLTNGDGENDLELDASVEKPPTVEDRSQEEDKEIESVEDGRNPSASEDKQETGSSTIHLAAKKRRPKTIKHWLRDPNLYKVCVFF